ncbi:primosomal protein N' [Propioniciclava sp. MC1595]|uniref:primosomal protein N' n=1 Tax=Propioniciclava sp. MC1595 TaxID=2760308 RepID=UPI0016626793|nr:primosomal protein N' [Propioniciclava sp. MC1595]MBB1495977.1 primosomal protein N' [Propioniciclava sp. MC1595]QTE24646.1 primosomal protein N' [Propioniciclava sp. MC1595]
MGQVRVARVAVDVPLPHLDRVFDYAITDEQADAVQPGVRVRVRFAGKLRDAWVLEVADTTDLDKLAPLERVVSPEVVLSDAVAGLVREVADHWGGTFSDVARLAVPPRHAASEAAARPDRPEPAASEPSGVLAGHPGGERYLAGLAAGEPLRAAWNPVPVFGAPGDWAGGVLDAVGATLSAGRGAIVVVPDGDALDALVARCTAAFGKGSFTTLTAELGPATRYRNFLAVARGDVRLVLGTRAAVYAPVHDLGLVAVWDEGNDLLAEPRAPYPHAREVAALRAGLEHSALLLAGYGRTAEVQALVEKGWLVALAHEPREVRRLGPAVHAASHSDRAEDRDPAARAARLPHDVFTTIRAGLASGPVLLQVPRAGYAPSMACQECRELARCPRCSHPLRGERGGVLVCRSCGVLPGPWACPTCGGGRLRAPTVGVRRTAEELGRAFPQVRVVQSWSGHLVDEVGEEPALVLATPGAEPRAEAGYAAAILMDTGLLLGRPDLRAAEEALRRWLHVCALVRPGSHQGTVMAVGEPDARAIQALIRLDAPGFAARELAERVATRFPPAARLVQFDGPRAALDEAEAAWRPVPGAEHFGPVPLETTGEGETWRLTVRCPPAHGDALVAGLKEVVADRLARKAPGALRLQVDPS